MNRRAIHKISGFVFSVFLFGLFLYSDPGLKSALAKEKKLASYALLMGTCFNEKGFSLPGVNLLVEMKLEGDQKAKKKKWEIVSSPRGEFAFRLPAGPNRFQVIASKKGFKSIEKTVSFAGDERQDIIFTMQPLTEQK